MMPKRIKLIQASSKVLFSEKSTN